MLFFFLLFIRCVEGSVLSEFFMSLQHSNPCRRVQSVWEKMFKWKNVQSLSTRYIHKQIYYVIVWLALILMSTYDHAVTSHLFTMFLAPYALICFFLSSYTLIYSGQIWCLSPSNHYYMVIYWDIQCTIRSLITWQTHLIDSQFAEYPVFVFFVNARKITTAFNTVVIGWFEKILILMKRPKEFNESQHIFLLHLAIKRN